MKRIKLKVFHQKNKSQDCGPVCVQMILDHFGSENKLADLKKGMKFEIGGTYLFDNGLHFLNEGLHVELVTANPRVFKREDLAKLKTGDDIKRHLTSLQRKNKEKKIGLDVFKEFIFQGGKVQLKIPSIEHILKALDQNKLVMALVYGGALGKNEGGFHFVVVSGYKNGFVYINNPLKNARQGWFKEEDFMYALHSSTCVDIDNGSLLIVGRQEVQISPRTVRQDRKY